VDQIFNSIFVDFWFYLFADINFSFFCLFELCTCLQLLSSEICAYWLFIEICTLSTAPNVYISKIKVLIKFYSFQTLFSVSVFELNNMLLFPMTLLKVGTVWFLLNYRCCEIQDKNIDKFPDVIFLCLSN